MNYSDLDKSYVSIKFVTGQDIIGYQVSDNVELETITFKRLMYVLPSQTTEGQMDLSPFLGFVEIEDEHEFNKKDIMNVAKPDDKITDMMTKSFSAIIQPEAAKSNVSKLIL